MISNPSKRSRRHKKSSSSHRRARRHKNPSVNRHRAKHYFAKSARRNSRRRRHNPGLGSIGGFSLKEVAYLGAGAAAGGIGSRMATQVVLGTKNVGYVGYLAQAIASLIAGWGAAKVFKNKALGYSVASGGFAFLLARIYEEKIGASISLHGLGDIAYSPAGLGEFLKTPFSIPSVSSNVGGNYVIQNAGALPAAAAAASIPAGGGASGMSQIFKNPFN